MKWFIGFLVMAGILFFLGREYQARFPLWPRLSIFPDLAVLQTVPVGYYAVGQTDLLSAYQPFGYLTSEMSVITSTSVPFGQRQAALQVPVPDVAIIDIAGQRWWWFGPEADFRAVEKLPLSLQADGWLLSGTMPPDHWVSPRSMLVWLPSDKRVPKRLKTLSDSAHLPLLVPADIGARTLYYRAGQWQF